MNSDPENHAKIIDARSCPGTLISCTYTPNFTVGQHDVDSIVGNSQHPRRFFLDFCTQPMKLGESIRAIFCVITGVKHKILSAEIQTQIGGHKSRLAPRPSPTNLLKPALCLLGALGGNYDG